MKRGLPVRDLDELRAAFVARRRELGMTQLECDARAGLQDGYTGKWEAGIKGLGRVSLGCLLGALGLRLMVSRADHKRILIDENPGFSSEKSERNAKECGTRGARVTNRRHAKRKAAWGRKGARIRWARHRMAKREGSAS